MSAIWTHQRTGGLTESIEFFALDEVGLDG
jgi:hypothetical protein